MARSKSIESKVSVFTLTTDHVKLLRAMWINFENAPLVDQKKPYGDSDIEENIYEILTGRMPDDGLTRKWVDHARKLHRETQHALQIVLKMGEFKLGTYKLDNEYDVTSWVFVE